MTEQESYFWSLCRPITKLQGQQKARRCLKCRKSIKMWNEYHLCETCRTSNNQYGVRATEVYCEL